MILCLACFFHTVQHFVCKNASVCKHSSIYYHCFVWLGFAVVVVFIKNNQQPLFCSICIIFYNLQKRSTDLLFHLCCTKYVWFKYNLGQKYQAPQVRPDWGSKSWPPDHDSTFHVTETPDLTTSHQWPLNPWVITFLSKPIPASKHQLFVSSYRWLYWNNFRRIPSNILHCIFLLYWITPNYKHWCQLLIMVNHLCTDILTNTEQSWTVPWVHTGHSLQPQFISSCLFAILVATFWLEKRIKCAL